MWQPLPSPARSSTFPVQPGASSSQCWELQSHSSSSRTPPWTEVTVSMSSEWILIRNLWYTQTTVLIQFVILPQEKWTQECKRIWILFNFHALKVKTGITLELKIVLVLCILNVFKTFKRLIKPGCDYWITAHAQLVVNEIFSCVPRNIHPINVQQVLTVQTGAWLPFGVTCLKKLRFPQ